jgi:hypothetical protein
MGVKVKGRGRLPGRTVAYRPHRKTAKTSRIVWLWQAPERSAAPYRGHRRVSMGIAVFIVAAALAIAALVFLVARSG